MSTLSDIYQVWSADLTPAPSGDLATATGYTRTQQRILRRLMTSPAQGNLPPDYIWHATYGAGLPRLIGTTTTPETIQGIVIGQMKQEQSVAQTPPPTCQVQVGTNFIALTLNFTDNATGQPSTLSYTFTPD